MNLEFAEATQIGGRERNEDCQAHLITKQGALFLVADGLGGYRGGELASNYFCRAVLNQLPDYCSRLNKDPENAMKSLIDQAAEEMIRSLEPHALDTQPQTTCVLAWITDQQVISAHIGDSRFYLLDRQQVLWRSRDHSVAEIMVAEGQLDENEVSRHPDQAKLYRSIGGDKVPKPSIKTFEALQPGQGILLCSDGFWEYISAEEMIDLVARQDLTKDLELCTQKSVRRAGSGSDNVTATFIRINNKVV